MVIRVLFTAWFLVASVFAPAFCCCAPFSARTAQAAEPTHHAANPAEAKPTCPHCKLAAQPEHESPAGKSPCPSHPTRDHCPCKERQIAQAAPAAPELRTAVIGDWLPDLVLFSPAPSAHDALSQGALRPADHTGPPPLSGVDLLRRLHILIC